MAGLSILFVTPRFPLPLLSGDRARAFHQLRLLARRHRVTLVTYADPAQADEARIALEARGVRIVTEPFSAVRAAGRVVRGTWSKRPLQVAFFDSRRLRGAIRALAARERFDLAHVQLARAVPLVGDDLRLPRVVDLVDALSLNMARRAAHDRGITRWAARVDADRLQAYERQICAHADAATVAAPADREAIGRFRSLYVNPNGVDLAAFPHLGGARDGKRIVFSGNLGYFPNVDGICWFVKHVMPHVWREEPRAHLTLAGARPDLRIQALARRDPRIEVTGYVERLHPWLAASRVAVAPMISGSGQLLKVLEAMATGTPVVGTSLGLNGIDARGGEQALVGDTPEELASHVVAVLRDDRLAAGLAAAGRELVERLYTWERSVAALEGIYREVTGSFRAAAGCA
jgi:sugar transferase (PEP-CTERM/EpsH1 system associated)